MGEEDAFLAAIAADPRDDATRLVYSDWLEERDGLGDAARAAFIRLSVRKPDDTFWSPDANEDEDEDGDDDEDTSNATHLCRDHWHDWMEALRDRLVGSPLHRWLGTPDCRWAYRRGMIAVFSGTQQVLLDAWDELFRVGPVEEIEVRNLWYFGTVIDMRSVLDRPSLRAMRLRAARLHDNCVDQLIHATDWFRRLEAVELVVEVGEATATRRLADWLASDKSLPHVRWRSGTGGSGFLQWSQSHPG